MFRHSRSDAEPGSAPDPPAAAATATTASSWSDSRGRLLEAMIETVALRGYDRATIGRVLASAGVEESVFDEHFGDKRDCFLQAVDDLFARAELAALEQFQRPGSWAQRVQAALGVLLRALAANPPAARVAFVEMFGEGQAACERYRSALALFTSLVEQGRSSSSCGEHLPVQTSEAIVGGIASILQRRILQGETAELPGLHADLTYFALLPYLDHEGALEIAGLPAA